MSHFRDFVCLGLKSSVNFKQAEGGSGNERGDTAFGSTVWLTVFGMVFVFQRNNSFIRKRALL